MQLGILVVLKQIDNHFAYWGFLFFSLVNWFTFIHKESFAMLFGYRRNPHHSGWLYMRLSLYCLLGVSNWLHLRFWCYSSMFLYATTRLLDFGERTVYFFFFWTVYFLTHFHLPGAVGHLFGCGSVCVTYSVGKLLVSRSTLKCPPFEIVPYFSCSWKP